MSQRYVVFLLLCGVFVTPRAEAQITSVAGGGNWWEANTWIGGEVPTANDDVVLNGAVVVRSGDTCRDLTLNASSSLMDYSGGNFQETLVIEGDVENRGAILESEQRLTLTIRGDVHNAGTWAPTSTTLDGANVQVLSQGNGAAFEGNWTNNTTARDLQAGSDLTIAHTFDLNGGVLSMAGFALTTDEDTQVIDGTLHGPATLHGTFHASTGITFDGAITVAGTLEDNDGGNFIDQLRLHGTLVNQGALQTRSGGLLLLVDGGHVVNQGQWMANETRFIGTGEQTLSHTAGHPLGGGWSATDSSTVTATSALHFREASIDLNRGVLASASFPVTLEHSTLTDGQVEVSTLVMAGSGSRMAVEMASAVVLRGGVQVASGMVFRESVTVADTLRDSPAGNFVESMTVEKTLRNEGVIEGNLDIHALGDLVNAGTWTNRTTLLAGRGPRSITGQRIDSPLILSGEEVVLEGDMTLDGLSIRGDAFGRLSSSGTLRLPAGGLSGAVSNFANFGRVVIHQDAPPNRTLSFFDLSVRTPADVDYDSLVVETYGNQVPATYGGAVLNWWRLLPSTTTGATLPELTFTYRPEQLGMNDASTLEVYHSTDDGETWRQLSTSQNLTRDPDEHTVTLANAPSSGDFLLSSFSDPTSVAPNVIVSITGRTNIRIGAPNQYLVHYVNNSNRPTGDMMMAVHLTEGGRIQRITPSSPNEDTDFDLEPEELSFEDVSGDTLALLHLAGMDAHEERSFFLVATADPEDAGKRGQVDFVTPTLALIVLAGTTVIINELSFQASIAAQFCRVVREEVERFGSADYDFAWREGRRRATREREKRKILTGISTLYTSVKAVLTDRIGAAAAGRFTTAALKCMGNLGLAGLRAMQDGINGVFEPVHETIRSCGAGGKRSGSEDTELCRVNLGAYGTQVTWPTVRSWDPNEKTGPNGFGERGFITSAGRMNYTVLFENKAEATAAAFRVVIHDTLSAIFDPETVEFGETSHEGFTMTREGNVLRWEIEGIELPPNVTPPEGEGFVTFSVEVREGLDSGTAIENQATIVFDANPPITTNAVVNTLDFVPPSTVMLPISEHIEGTEAVVRWESSDGVDGSGVGVVNIFAAQDGGAFDLVGSTVADSFAVPLDADGTYSFYALAVDQVGNAEQIRPEPVTTNVTLVGAEEESIPFAFRLNQNYPNPFNPVTTISYTLPAPGETTVRIYDVTGRLVATPVDGLQSAGPHQVVWDARPFASGVYFYRLQSGKQVDVKPMLLVK